MSTLTAIPTSCTRLLSLLTVIVKAFIRTLTRTEANYRQQTHLEALPEHLLKDIGLTRDHIALTRRQLLPWWM